MLSDPSPNTVCFFLLEDSGQVPEERDPRQRLAYLGVTKFELEFVLAPDQYLKSKWSLKSLASIHSEAPGVIPSSLRDGLGLNLEYNRNSLKVLFNHNRKTASSRDSVCSSLVISFYQEMTEEGPLVLENGGKAFCVKSWAVGRALA